MNKTKPTKFTFKNYPKPTGLWAVVAGTPSIDVKYAGVAVGRIDFNDKWNSRVGGIRINIKVPTDPVPDTPCSWKWVTLRGDFASGEEAKNFLNDRFEELSKRVFVDSE
jgi:hypothetical protein